MPVQISDSFRASDVRDSPRAARLRSPLLWALWVLLTVEAVGGLVIFVARLAVGRTPGESLHVIAGLALTVVYVIYQWGHWRRVAPFRARLDYALGLLASIFLALTNVSGLILGLSWWRDRIALPLDGEVAYPAMLSAIHNIGSMLVLTFVAGHLGAVLMRDRRTRRR